MRPWDVLRTWSGPGGDPAMMGPASRRLHCPAAVLRRPDIRSHLRAHGSGLAALQFAAPEPTARIGLAVRPRAEGRCDPSRWSSGLTRPRKDIPDVPQSQGRSRSRGMRVHARLMRRRRAGQHSRQRYLTADARQLHGYADADRLGVASRQVSVILRFGWGGVQHLGGGPGSPVDGSSWRKPSVKGVFLDCSRGRCKRRASVRLRHAPERRSSRSSQAGHAGVPLPGGEQVAGRGMRRLTLAVMDQRSALGPVAAGSTRRRARLCQAGPAGRLGLAHV